jgi:tetratricopeptide (TPR) repeat protein
MRPLTWLPLLLLAAACPKEQPPADSGSTALAETGTSSSSPAEATTVATESGTVAATTERLTGPDGRLQAVDAYGNPLFDATGKPIWEQTPQEKAAQLFEEAMVLRKGVGGQPPSPTGAADRLRDAVKVWPEFVEGWYALANVNLDQNLLPEARDAFQRVSALKADDPRGWVGVGIVGEREEAWSAAQIAYERGLATAPQNVDLMNGRVRVLRARGMNAQAITEALKIIAINSNSLDAYNSLGLAYMEQGEYELARFVFVKAKSSLPGGAESATLEANLGLVYLRQGKEFDAGAQFEKARSLDVNHVGANVNLAYLALRNYDFESAQSKLELAHRILPNNVPIQLNLAVARRGMGDVSGARSLLEPIANAPGPYQIDATYNLAILQGDFLKDYKAAIDGYNQFLNLRSQSGSPVEAADPVFGYIREAERALKRQEQKRAKEAAAASAPPPAPAPAPVAPLTPAPGEPAPTPANP